MYIKALEKDKSICCEVTTVSKSISIQLLHNEKGQIEIVSQAFRQALVSWTRVCDFFCSVGAQALKGKESASAIAMTEVGQDKVEERDDFWASGEDIVKLFPICSKSTNIFISEW